MAVHQVGDETLDRNRIAIGLDNVMRLAKLLANPFHLGGMSEVEILLKWSTKNLLIIIQGP